MSAQREASTDIVIGVDLGGTKIETIVARRAGRSLDVISRRRAPTESERGYEAVIEAAARSIEAAAIAEGLELRATPIGMGMPGGVTRRSGLVKNCNATCLNGRPFRRDLEARVGRAITFDNDASCFALAEATLGAGAPYADGVVFGVIMGTGVGGGIVIRGEMWSGAQGIAGEWGHHVIERAGRACYCGEQGCLERYLAGPAIEADYAARTGEPRKLAEIAARREDDVDAGAVIDAFLDAFGRGLANVVNILDPSVIVLGGGVSNLDLLYDEGVARVGRYVFNDELTTPIAKAALGDSAGVLGAALLAR